MEQTENIQTQVSPVNNVQNLHFSRKKLIIGIGLILVLATVFVLGMGYGVLSNNGKATQVDIVKKNMSDVSPTTDQVNKEIIEVKNETQSVGLVSTESWKNVTFEDVSLKVPSQAEVVLHNYPETCQDNFDKCYKVRNHDPNDQYQGIEIAIKPYSGGSRRAEADWVGVFEYKNIKVGDYDALEATFICQIDSCTPFRRVLVVLGNNLISIQDSTYLDNSGGRDGTEANPWRATLESPITNTIISTIQ